MTHLVVESFASRWRGKGNEKSDTQKFWLEVLSEVLSIILPTQYIEFEKRVELEHVSFIDAYISSTRTIIEQKSYGVNLEKAVPQSDGQLMTPFQQAKRYSDWLPDSERARWIVVCNFQSSECMTWKSRKPILKLCCLRTWPGIGKSCPSSLM